MFLITNSKSKVSIFLIHWSAPATQSYFFNSQSQVLLCSFFYFYHHGMLRIAKGQGCPAV